jgi:hypothetical protein
MVVPGDMPAYSQRMSAGRAIGAGVEAAAIIGGVGYGGMKARSARALGPRDESLLSSNPKVRGYEVEDVRQRETYSQQDWVRSRRFQEVVDFTYRNNLEKAEMKTLDITAKSYRVTNLAKNGLKDTLEGYRNKLNFYDRGNPTTFNTLEIQLMNARRMDFSQDRVIREFVQESYRHGIIVEIHDYSTGRVLVQPGFPK